MSIVLGTFFYGRSLKHLCLYCPSLDLFHALQVFLPLFLSIFLEALRFFNQGVGFFYEGLRLIVYYAEHYDCIWFVIG